LRGGPRGDPPLPCALVPVLADRFALLPPPPRRRLPARLRAQPLLRRILPRARFAARPFRRGDPPPYGPVAVAADDPRWHLAYRPLAEDAGAGGIGCGERERGL